MRFLAMCLACLLASESPAGEKDFPVRSCFATSVPAVRSGEVLIQTHLYLACVDTDAKQAAWIAYHVSRSDWDTENVLDRNFSTPPDLRPICLEQSDYAASGYDLGHLYGLQHVSANRYASEVNQLQAVIAQRPELNRGPWLKAEDCVHQLSASRTVFVMAGQLWESPMPALPNADESHLIGSHCWIIYGDGESEVGYLFPQDCALGDPLSKFAMDPKALRKRISSVWWSGAK